MRIQGESSLENSSLSMQEDSFDTTNNDFDYSRNGKASKDHMIE